MKQKLLGIALIVLIGLTGCAKKEPLPAIASWDKNQDPYFKVRFDYPKGWFKGGESGKISFTSSEGAVGKFFDPTSKEAPDGAQILVSYEKQDTLKTLEAFVDDDRTDLNASGFNLKPIEPATVDGTPALKFSYSGRYSNTVTIEATRVFILKDSVLYKAVFWAFNDYFMPYRAAIDTFIATAELPRAKAAKVDESLPSTTYDTYKNDDYLSIQYPNNFNPTTPAPKGKVQFMLMLQGYRNDSNILIDVRPAEKLTLEKVVDQNAKSYKATSSGETTIDGQKAHYLNYSMSKGVASRVYFVVKNDKFYRIIVNYYEPAKKDFLPAFEKSIASLRIK
ncbi:MAG: PsbP-related protein [Ignavibacteriales bacterium]|nr:PsbP-related protein [Ignavibacteriales bacterium]